jgi:hypothetical protein
MCSQRRKRLFQKCDRQAANCRARRKLRRKFDFTRARAVFDYACADTTSLTWGFVSGAQSSFGRRAGHGRFGN